MVSSLSGGLLTFPQVGLRLDEVRMEQHRGLFLIQLGAPGLAVFLKFPCFYDKSVRNADKLSLYDGLARRIVNALIQSCVEASSGLL